MLRPFLLAIFSLQSLQALTPSAHIQSRVINESSGIVASRQHPGVFWTHNDSGDRARIFAIDLEGNSILPDTWTGPDEGIQISGAQNIDWEDIATDDHGQLVIADFGNNGNARRDLKLYLIDEPDPRKNRSASILQTVRFRYADQTEYPPEALNYDAEALFYAYDHFYLLTKHRGNHATKLYRFDTLDSESELVLEPIERFDIGGMVTAADFDPVNQRLAVLTYNNLWVFETSPDNLLGGRHYKLKLDKTTEQCEAVCFSGDEIILTNEQTAIFRIQIAEMIP